MTVFEEGRLRGRFSRAFAEQNDHFEKANAIWN